MTLSFRSLWEQMDKKTPLMTSGVDSQALTAIRAGEGLHGEDETPFWDEFINICANREGLAELLDVSPDKVSSWPARIKEYRDEMEKHNTESPHEEEETEMIPTGDNGAIVTNQDPYLGEM
jgi:hypothetical protein